MAHTEIEELLNALLPFARQQLGVQGEFCPFGATISIGGERRLVAAHLEDDHPTSQTVIDIMRAGALKEASAGEIRAFGICFDVRVVPPGKSEKTDAICVQLEHSSGEALSAYLPYKKAWLRGYKFGELFFAPGERVTWPG